MLRWDATVELMTIGNFLPITPTLSTSGQPMPEAFEAIRSAGFSLVVNLATPASESWNPSEQAIVESLGMTYVGIPVDWENPTLADFEDLADLLDASLDTSGDRQVWVHCALNWRVSAMIYLYQRLRRKQPQESALRNLAAIWVPNQVWQEYIDAVMELYEP
jgi:protein tyrosine phosphatase (PTP) superfamily phosphohydrolase (DUF442 family)